MASKWLADPVAVTARTAGDGTPLKPWQDPLHVDHFAMSSDARAMRVIRLTPEATSSVWEMYRKSRKDVRFTILLSYAGDVLDSKLSEDSAWWPAQRAMEEMCAVYNMHRRRCWRPVWPSATPLDIRGLGNASYESVLVYASDKLVEGWETRPRAKLFVNS